MIYSSEYAPFEPGREYQHVVSVVRQALLLAKESRLVMTAANISPVELVRAALAAFSHKASQFIEVYKIAATFNTGGRHKPDAVMHIARPLTDWMGF